MSTEVAPKSRHDTIAAGYKQTDFGIIPTDWDDTKLANIAKDDAPICYGIVQVGPYRRSGVPVLAIKNLNSDYMTDIHRASLEIERPYARSRIRPDDVLISVKGTTGRIGIVPVGFHGNISRDLARIRLREGVVPEFVCQMLRSDLVRRRLLMAAVGTTRMELSIAILKEVRIPVPSSEPEQEAIATALSDVDALINSLDRLIAKKRDIKQATMQQLLTGKTRLPGFSGAWKTMKLGELCGTVTTGKLDANAMVQDGDYPFFTCARQPCQINVFAFDAEALMVSGNGANVGYIHHYRGRFNAYQRTYVLLNFSENVLFLKLFMENFLQDRIRTEVNAGNTPYIKIDTLTQMSILLPESFTEQETIATVLQDIDTELSTLEQRRDKTLLLKQGMMQELLTGRTRLV